MGLIYVRYLCKMEIKSIGIRSNRMCTFLWLPVQIEGCWKAVRLDRSFLALPLLLPLPGLDRFPAKAQITLNQPNICRTPLPAQQALFTADIATCQTRDPFHQVSLWAMPVTEHAQYQIPGTSSPKWNAAIFNVINCTCAFPALSSQNVCWQKALEDILGCIRYTLCFTLQP